MWQVTLGIGTLLLIILASALFGAIGIMVLLVSAFKR